jgi:hypothetical protein
MTAFSSPLYLWLDSKTDTYPNPTAGLKSRSVRTTEFSFQTDGCDYFVDVWVKHADSPEATKHEVTIKISDFVSVNDEGFDRVKQYNFLPIQPGQSPSVGEARKLADIHLTNYIASCS